jgi:hypothetical protein
VLDYRVSDILTAVSDSFLPALIRQYGAPFNITHFGVFGHSIGGAAAAVVIASNSSEGGLFKAGCNLDGTMYQFLVAEGSNATHVPARDLKRPFLEVAAENHLEGIASIRQSGDYTWEYFNNAQSGWLRDVQVNGTRHLDFSDIPLWIDLLDQRKVLNRTWVGLANGVRVTGLVNALLRELFGSIEGKALDEVDEWVDKAPELLLLDHNEP